MLRVRPNTAEVTCVHRVQVTTSLAGMTLERSWGLRPAYPSPPKCVPDDLGAQRPFRHRAMTVLRVSSAAEGHRASHQKHTGASRPWRVLEKIGQIKR